jgi:hypothetical protein
MPSCRLVVVFEREVWRIEEASLGPIANIIYTFYSFTAFLCSRPPPSSPRFSLCTSDYLL